MNNKHVEHYNYFMHITGDNDVQELLCAVLVALILVYVGSRLAAKIKNPQQLELSVIPSEKPNFFGWFDFIVEIFIRFQDSILGKENRKYFSFTFTIFLFIFTVNLIGLIPGMPAVATTVWINVGMAIFAFIFFNYQGVKEHGFWGYIKHFAGPIMLLAPLIFPLEILSLFLRILTLNLRLYWNITADHLVLHILTSLAKVFAVPVYILGTFVGFMQAFVFTTLIMIYILLATQHDDGHAESAQH